MTTAEGNLSAFILFAAIPKNRFANSDWKLFYPFPKKQIHHNMDKSISILLVQINSAKPHNGLGKDSKSGNEKMNNKTLRSDRIKLFFIPSLSCCREVRRRG